VFHIITSDTPVSTRDHWHTLHIPEWQLIANATLHWTKIHEQSKLHFSWKRSTVQEKHIF